MIHRILGLPGLKTKIKTENSTTYCRSKMFFNIKNLGIIKEANFELSKFTLICGKNGQGKSFLVRIRGEYLYVYPIRCGWILKITTDISVSVYMFVPSVVVFCYPLAWAYRGVYSFIVRSRCTDFHSASTLTVLRNLVQRTFRNTTDKMSELRLGNDSA
jgi:hypothetical protein